MARSMIKGKGLQYTLQVDVVDTTVHILNRSYTKAIKIMTPLQYFFGKKPSITHFNIFGSSCYQYVLDPSRTNWDAKSQKCIFLGYIEESKGYQLYNYTTKKVIISRDVVFAQHPCHQEKDEDSSLDNQEISTYQPHPLAIGQEAPTLLRQQKDIQQEEVVEEELQDPNRKKPLPKWVTQLLDKKDPPSVKDTQG